MQVGLISQGYYFLLTSLDAHTVVLDDFKYGGTNITAFRLVNTDQVNRVLLLSIIEWPMGVKTEMKRFG